MAVILSHGWTFRRRAYERHRRQYEAEFRVMMAEQRRELAAAAEDRRP